MQGYAFAWPKVIDFSPKLSSRGVLGRRFRKQKTCSVHQILQRWLLDLHLDEASFKAPGKLDSQEPFLMQGEMTQPPWLSDFGGSHTLPLVRKTDLGTVICGKLAVATSPERSFHHSYHPAARTSVWHSLSIRSKIFFADICGMLSWQTTQQHLTCSNCVGCMTHHDTTICHNLSTCHKIPQYSH